MEQITETIVIAIIRESVSLFVLLVLIVLAYRLVDKFGTQFIDIWQDMAKSLAVIAKRKDE